MAVDLDALADDGPDDRVQPRAVAAAREHPDAHGRDRTAPARQSSGRSPRRAPARAAARSAGAAAVALAVAVLGSPARADTAPTPAPDAAALRADLERTTDRAETLAEDLRRAAARDTGLQQALEDLAAQADAAQARLDARARAAFERGGPDPLAGWSLLLATPDLSRAARQGLVASVRSERSLVQDAAGQAALVRRLQARAAAFRVGLRVRARAVLDEQERARELLAEAERVEAERAAAAVPSPATHSLPVAVAADAEAQRLAGIAARLAGISASVTRSLSPAQTARGRRAAAREAPVVALLAAAGSGYPPGWAPTGQTVEGTASWYGPGFVGSPTASGAPYDPELLTCAHRTLPLGTVLRVHRGSAAVLCLVTDRGPWVGDRVLDLSRAASRALGYDGTAEVVAEVLAPPAGSSAQ